ncbi:MAG: hypothetical protein AAF714_11690 [Pseudomonadota bacterium]
MFYGHASTCGMAIDPWWLIDLRSFRAALIRRSDANGLRYGAQQNPDGTQFEWFDLTSFPVCLPLVVAR